MGQVQPAQVIVEAIGEFCDRNAKIGCQLFTLAPGIVDLCGQAINGLVTDCSPQTFFVGKLHERTSMSLRAVVMTRNGHSTPNHTLILNG
jgi:hypothetical protein